MAHPNIETETTSESVEMYLLRVATLQQDDNPVPIPQLARELDISPVSANEMCRKLVEKGLTEYEPYKGVTLTGMGWTTARRVLRHRLLWEVFFVEKLGLDTAEADDMACRFEHVTPEKLADRLADFLGRPAYGPRKTPIPYEPATITRLATLWLPALAVGQQGRVLALDTGETVRTFLAGQGLMPGAMVTLLGVGVNGELLVETPVGPLGLAADTAAQVEIQPVA